MVRRQLGRKLRALREVCGKTRADVVTTKIMSHGKLEMIEYGRVVVRPGDVRELCALYRASVRDTEILRELALATNEDGWWQEREGVPDRSFEIFLDLESACHRILTFQSMVIAGLLQTEDYARAIERASNLGSSEAEIEGAVQVRMHRQRLLFSRDEPVELHCILGEAGLRLAVGDAAVRQAQFDHLRQVARSGQAELRVLPFSHGPHVGLMGDFVIMDFPDAEDLSIAYITSYVVSRYTERRIQVERHRQIYDKLYAHSIPLEEFTL